jgi:hypothetical protein
MLPSLSAESKGEGALVGYSLPLTSPTRSPLLLSSPISCTLGQLKDFEVHVLLG